MDEQFDNDLKNRIKEVFENLEDSSANEGWLLLRKKFPAEQSRRPLTWLWWGAAAAILLLFLGLGLWINNEAIQPEKLITKTAKHTEPANPVTGKANNAGSNKTIPVNGESLTKTTTTNNPVINSNHLKTSIDHKKQAPQGIIPKSFQGDTLSKNTFIAKTVDKAKNTNNKVPVQQLTATVQPSAVTSNQAIVSLQPGNKVVVQQPAVAVQPSIAPQSLVIIKPQPPAKSINSMFAEDKIVNGPKNDEELKNTKRVNFSVYAATYFNYAKGSNNQVNEGAGVTSDIRLSKNLKLVTGVAIAQNTLNYTAATPLPSVNEQSFSAQVAILPRAQNVYNVAVPTLNNYNASLVGLDIPLNLKYEFNPEKSDTYVSAGFSSGTFINQTYTYQYNYPDLLSASGQQTQSTVTRSNANSFYFAKTLNVAFGMGYPFGKNRLVIEPFLKYPLDGLGSQQIRFGAGGLNLKFNFDPKK